MENAVKALLISAGVLLAVMLLTLLVIGYDGISRHYQQQHELLQAEQLDKFNKQFQNYYGRDIRGNELISLMNKVIDYNASQSHQDGTGYEPIKVKINIGLENVDEFRYELDGVRQGTDIVGEEITNIPLSGEIDNVSDRNLVAITNTPAKMINDAGGILGPNLSDTHLQKLTAEISNIIFDEVIQPNTSDENRKMNNRIAENRRKRGILIKNILKLNVATSGVADIVLDPNNYYKADNVGQEIINEIKNIVSQYYQYSQFKRAYFTCTEMNHNTETGRVNEMNFEVKTKTVDDTTFVVFD